MKTVYVNGDEQNNGFFLHTHTHSSGGGGGLEMIFESRQQVKTSLNVHIKKLPSGSPWRLHVSYLQPYHYLGNTCKLAAVWMNEVFQWESKQNEGIR